MIVGITGKICSGKHTIAEFFKKISKGDIIDIDRLTHELYMKDTKCYKDIIDSFGKDILDETDNIDRKKLGEIVFKDKDKLKILNGIVHPKIKSIVQEIIVQKPTKCPRFIVSALLKELDIRTDFLVLVQSKLDKKKEWCKEKNISETHLLKSLEIQEEEDPSFYDYVVNNNKNIFNLNKEAKNIWKEIKDY